MNKFLFLAFWLMVLCLSCRTQSNQEESDVLGYMSGTKYIDNSFLLYPIQPSWQIISKYIQATPDRKEDRNMTPDDMAKIIITVSDCLAVDAAVMTGLIRQESVFDRTADEGNGTGLTQLTGVAVEEVNDQFGQRGTDNARIEAINYLNDRAKNCLAPKMNRGSWKQLWDVASDNDSSWRKVIVNDPLYAVIYGAVELKIYLSNNKRTHDYNLEDPKQMERLYHNALFDYNTVYDTYPDSVLRFAKEIAKMVDEGND